MSVVQFWLLKLIFMARDENGGFKDAQFKYLN